MTDRGAPNELLDVWITPKYTQTNIPCFGKDRQHLPKVYRDISYIIEQMLSLNEASTFHHVIFLALIIMISTLHHLLSSMCLSFYLNYPKLYPNKRVPCSGKDQQHLPKIQEIINFVCNLSQFLHNSLILRHILVTLCQLITEHSENSRSREFS